MSGTRESKPHLLRGRFLPLLGISLAVLGLGAYAAQSLAGAPDVTLVHARAGIARGCPRHPVTGGKANRLARDRPLCVCGSRLRQYALLYKLHLPGYTGPVVVGQALPAFETRRAGGTAFTERAMVGDQNSVLVFFRGRW